MTSPRSTMKKIKTKRSSKSTDCFDDERHLTTYSAFIIAGSPTIRAKREGFVDLQSLPTMMRGFADSLGRGFNSMVQQGQNLGHK